MQPNTYIFWKEFYIQPNYQFVWAQAKIFRDIQGLIKLLPVYSCSESSWKKKGKKKKESNWRRWSTKLLENIKKGENTESRKLDDATQDGVRGNFCDDEGNLRVMAAAARLLQSCLTLCDPIDGSPPGSPVPGILQARTLEWVAIAFSKGDGWAPSIRSNQPTQKLLRSLLMNQEEGLEVFGHSEKSSKLRKSLGCSSLLRAEAIRRW